mgnify:FL=1
MSLREDVAKAIYYATKPKSGWDGRADGYKQKWLDMAVAAIEAMREPTDGMRQRVAADWGHRTWGQYSEVIDAALEGK